MRSVIRRRQSAPARRRRDHQTLRHADGQVFGAGYSCRQGVPVPADRVSDSTDDRREALNWLAGSLRWERTLDALRETTRPQKPS
jgi:hypothetical protein